VIFIPFLFMGIFFFVFILIFAVVISAAVSGNPASEFDRLSQGGLPARGILLQVAQTASGLGGPIGRRFQRRSVRIDIEIPGRNPYELSSFAWIPMNCVRDVLPGATVELRVDPQNPQKFVIIGPGVGFAPPIVPSSQGPLNQGFTQ
jgi:hypothetical protein